MMISSDDIELAAAHVQRLRQIWYTSYHMKVNNAKYLVYSVVLTTITVIQWSGKRSFTFSCSQVVLVNFDS